MAAMVVLQPWEGDMYIMTGVSIIALLLMDDGGLPTFFSFMEGVYVVVVFLFHILHNVEKFLQDFS